MDLQIVLESSQLNAGDQAIGHVRLTSSVKGKISGIKFDFTGEARTNFETREDDNKSSPKTDIDVNKGYKEYCKVNYYLIGASANQTGGVLIEPGNLIFPFSFKLPTEIPPTYKGKWGFVRYRITVTTDIPWAVDIVQQKELNVKLPLNLNTQSHHDCASPFVVRKKKIFCCCLCASDPFNITVTVPVTGYVPGQSIPLTIECQNNSDVDIESIDFRLVRNVEFTTTQQKKIEQDIIAAEVVGPLPEEKTLTVTKYLDIPLDTVPWMDHCNLIKFEYQIEMEALPSGCHLGFNRKIPILLGTTPLVSFQQIITSKVNLSDVELNVSSPQSSNIGWNVGLNNQNKD